MKPNAYNANFNKCVSSTLANQITPNPQIGLPYQVTSSKHNSISGHVKANSSKKKNKKQTYKISKGPSNYLAYPPHFVTDRVRKIKRRFECIVTATSTISIPALLNCHLLAVSAVLGYSVFRAVRIKRVQLWMPVAIQGVAAEVTLTPISDGPTASNSFVDLPMTYQDSTISVDYPAYIDFRPKPTELSGSWHISSAGNDNLIDIVAQTGCIMDLTLEVIDNLTTVPLGYTQVLAAATVGQQYCRAIGSFTPVGINTI
jgi:hypothetical protein